MTQSEKINDPNVCKVTVMCWQYDCQPWTIATCISRKTNGRINFKIYSSEAKPKAEAILGYRVVST